MTSFPVFNRCSWRQLPVADHCRRRYLQRICAHALAAELFLHSEKAQSTAKRRLFPSSRDTTVGNMAGGSDVGDAASCRRRTQSRRSEFVSAAPSQWPRIHRKWAWRRAKAASRLPVWRLGRTLGVGDRAESRTRLGRNCCCQLPCHTR